MSETKIEPDAETELASRQHKFDPVAFDAAIAKWYGFGQERMRELGFETTDDFMKAIRGR